MQRFTGTLKWFGAERGFGFVFRDGSDVQDFLHITALQLANINADALRDGITRFSYTTEARPNGKSMVADVQIID